MFKIVRGKITQWLNYLSSTTSRYEKMEIVMNKKMPLNKLIAVQINL